MSEEKYNGHTNWETWNISLWLSNDELMYNQTKEIVNGEYEYHHKMIDKLEDFVLSLLDSRIITDHVSIHRVNMHEVAEDFVDDRNTSLSMFLRQHQL